MCPDAAGRRASTFSHMRPPRAAANMPAAFHALWNSTEPRTTFGTRRNRNLCRRFSRQAAPTTAANHAMEGNAHD